MRPVMLAPKQKRRLVFVVQAILILLLMATCTWLYSVRGYGKLGG